MHLPYRPELIIFDLDGTLADTISDIASAVNRTLAYFGFPQHPTESYKLMVGEGFRTLMQKALPKEATNDEVLIQSALDRALKDYAENILVETSLFPGVLRLLRTLSKRGYKLAVLSNKPDQMTQTIVRALCGTIDFVAVWGNSAKRPRKPNPESALRIAMMTGVPPERCLFVGDSSIDMLTAKSAGMTAVGALYGYRSREELQGADAEYFIGAPLELLDLIGAPRVL